MLYAPCCSCSPSAVVCPTACTAADAACTRSTCSSGSSSGRSSSHDRSGDTLLLHLLEAGDVALLLVGGNLRPVVRLLTGFRV